MTFRGLFVSGDGRVRAGWRIAIFFLVFSLIAVAVSAVFGKPLAAFDRWLGIKDAGDEIGATISALLATAVMIRLIDRRPWSYLRLGVDVRGPRFFGYGLALGATPIAIASLLLIALGWLSFRSAAAGSWIVAALQVSALLAPAALMEEVLSRGYIFSALSDGVTTPGAVAITSVAFGFLHLGNDGVTPLAIGSVVLAGIFLAVVMLATKSLYAAWAAHFAWNWVMAVPLHVVVSGTPIPAPGYQLVDSGPDWASGGEWGPEGGAFAMIAMFAGMAWLYSRNKKASNNNLQTSNAVQ